MKIQKDTFGKTAFIFIKKNLIHRQKWVKINSIHWIQTDYSPANIYIDKINKKNELV